MATSKTFSLKCQSSDVHDCMDARERPDIAIHGTAAYSHPDIAAHCHPWHRGIPVILTSPLIAIHGTAAYSTSMCIKKPAQVSG